MRSSLQAAKTACLLGVLLLSLAPLASAEPKEEVAGATAAWAQALGQDEQRWQIGRAHV